MLSYSQLIWTACALVLLAATTLLTLRREVALRLANLRWPVLAAMAVRIVVLACGSGFEAVDFVAWPLSISLLAGLHATRDGRLIRTTRSGFKRELEDACARLRLACEETYPGEFRFTQPDRTYVLIAYPLLERLQYVRMPRQSKGKSALLVAWLRKRYHSVAPRFHIVLSSSRE